MSANQEEGSNTSISSVVTRNDISSTAILKESGSISMGRDSGREFSRMSPETAFVVRLARSAYVWQQRQNDKECRALSYPKAAAFADGYKGTRQFGAIVPDLDPEPTPTEYQDIFDAVKSLTDIRRKVFEGIHRDGLDRRKVARLINGTARSVDTRLNQAYMVLAGFLRGRGWTL